MLKSLFIMGKFVALCWTCSYTAAKKSFFPTISWHNPIFFLRVYPRARCLGILWDKLQLLKTMMFLGIFGFGKKCQKYWNLHLTKNIWFFLLVFHDYLFFLKFLPHFWQVNSLYFFSTWLITVIKLVMYIFVEEVSRWNSTSKNIYLKKKNFFGLLCKDFKISNIFY